MPVCDDLGFDRGAFSLYLTFYFIATTFTYPFVAKFLPKWDFRAFLSGCVIVLGITWALMGSFNELWQFYVAGVVLGIAGALVFVVASTVLIENWFADRRGTALGIAMCGSGIGGVVFPIIGNMMLETIGWRMTYVAFAVIMCVMILPWSLFVFRLHPEDVGLKPYGAEKMAAMAGAEEKTSGIPAKKAILTLAFVCIFLYAASRRCSAATTTTFRASRNPLATPAAFGAGILSLAQLGYTVATLVMGWVTDKIGVAGVHVHHAGHHGLVAGGLLPVPERGPADGGGVRLRA